MYKKAGLIAASFVLAVPAFAGVIVDTGPVLEEKGGLSMSAVWNKGLWITSTFQVTKLAEIDRINGWVSTALAGHSGDLTIALFSSKTNGTPDEMLYSGKTFVPTNHTGWAGVSNVDVLLDTGLYLVGFNVASDSSFHGYMDNQMPRPGHTTYVGRFIPEDRQLEQWNGSNGLGISFQVFSKDSSLPPDTPEIPEPSSIMLSALGIAALGAARRRYHRSV